MDPVLVKVTLINNFLDKYKAYNTSTCLGVAGLTSVLMEEMFRCAISAFAQKHIQIQLNCKTSEV